MIEGSCELSRKKQRLLSKLTSEKHFICGRAVSLMVSACMVAIGHQRDVLTSRRP